jgi:hypothetical protein
MCAEIRSERCRLIRSLRKVCSQRGPAALGRRRDHIWVQALPIGPATKRIPAPTSPPSTPFSGRQTACRTRPSALRRAEKTALPFTSRMTSPVRKRRPRCRRDYPRHHDALATVVGRRHRGAQGLRAAPLVEAARVVTSGYPRERAEHDVRK